MFQPQPISSNGQDGVEVLDLNSNLLLTSDGGQTLLLGGVGRLAEQQNNNCIQSDLKRSARNNNDTHSSLSVILPI